MRKAIMVGAAWLMLGWGAEGAKAALGVKAIAAGDQRSLALASDGTVWEWGRDWQPQWGGPVPSQVGGLSAILAIAGSPNYSLALKADGTVWAWGGGWSSTELTHNSAPIQLGGLAGIVAVAGGVNHSLALKADGTVWAFGYNFWGELGDGTTTNSATPVQVRGLSGVQALAAGNQYSLALRADGTVWAWGNNRAGQLGDGTTTSRSTPTQVSGLSGVVAIAAGDSHVLALKRDGTVWEWGTVIYDAIWPPTASLTPVQVTGLAGVVGVAAGYAHSLAVKDDGTVWEWGSRIASQTLFAFTDLSTPNQVAGLAGAVAVADGMAHSLALKSDGTIWAWGANDSGQLGDGTTAYRSTRIPVNGIGGVTAVAGAMGHSLALKGDGTVWAWGRNAAGQLGDGTTTNRTTPVQVSRLTGVTAIGAGTFHGLALRDDGTVWAWGGSGFGQLGDGTVTNEATLPVPVSGLTDVSAIAVAGFHNLALKRDGTVWAWGANWSGQLGDGTILQNGGRSTPVLVVGLTGVVAVAADSDHSLALKSDGTVWAWGWNEYGQLGVGTTTNQLTPAQVIGLSAVKAIAVAAGGSLALKGDGTVWEWSFPERGIQSTPTEVRGLSGVVAIAGGNAIDYMCGNCGHRLALKSDGTVWAWGDDDDGQLGDGNTTTWPGRMTPAPVGGLAGVMAIAAGDEHSLAVTRDGTVWAWGSNASGQLALETTAFRTTPVQVVPPGSPDLAIAMSHADDFAAGSQGAYTLNITNLGATVTSGTITVTDILPPGLTYLFAAGSGWTCFAADELVTCTSPGPIDSGAASAITLTVTVGPSALPGVTNFATVRNASDRNFTNDAIAEPTVVLAGR